MMDYAKKTGGLGPSFMPTGDYQADMQKISSFYHSVTPKYPNKAMEDIVATISAADTLKNEENSP